MRRPEDIGQGPDGDPPPPSSKLELAARRESASALLSAGDEATPADADEDSGVPGVTLQDALRTRGYWMLLFYNVVGCLPWQGLNFHMTSVLEENGLPESALPFVYTPLAITSCFGAVVGGVLLDSLNRRHFPLLALLRPDSVQRP